jgi:hypothetical protein
VSLPVLIFCSASTACVNRLPRVITRVVPSALRR